MTTNNTRPFTPIFRKFVALSVCLFLFNTHSFWEAAAYASLQTHSLAQEGAASSASAKLQEVVIPPEQGLIQSKDIVEGAPVVFLLQDAHAVGDAQFALSDLIGTLSTRYGVRDVLLEGAQGELDTLLFDAFPDREILSDFFRPYLEKGELSGATMARILNRADLGYYGMEDYKLYEEGLLSFLKGLQQREVVLPRLEREIAALRLQQREVYSEEAFKLTELIHAWQKNPKKFLELLKFIALHISDEEMPHTIQALIFFESQQSKNQIKPKQTIEKVLTEVLKQKNDHDLNQKKQDWQTEKVSSYEFLRYLLSFLSEEEGERLVSAEIKLALDHFKRLEETKSAVFLAEMEKLIGEVKKQLLHTPEMIELDSIGLQYDLLQKLVQFELSFDEWIQLKLQINGNNKVESFEQKKSNLYIDLESLEVFMQFYEITFARDDVFTRKILQKLKTASGHPVVAVTGGFHTQELRRRLSKEGVSIYVVSPRITTLPSENAYENYMQNEVSWRSYFLRAHGGVNLYDSFHRMAVEKIYHSKSSLEQRQLHKKWRENILRLLGDKKQMEKASAYTDYLDRVYFKLAYPTEFEEEASKLRFKIESFLSGLEHLDKTNQLNLSSVQQLLMAKTLHATAIPFQPKQLLSNSIVAFGEFQKNETLHFESNLPLVSLRSESREKTEFESVDGLSFKLFSEEDDISDKSQIYRFARQVFKTLRIQAEIDQAKFIEQVKREWTGRSLFQLNAKDALIAYRGNKPVGIYVFGYKKFSPTAWAESIYVSSDASDNQRNQGVATHLADTLFRYLYDLKYLYFYVGDERFGKARPLSKGQGAQSMAKSLLKRFEMSVINSVSDGEGNIAHYELDLGGVNVQLEYEDRFYKISPKDAENYKVLAESMAEALIERTEGKRIIAIVDGLMGSGKSTFSKRLIETLSKKTRYDEVKKGPIPRVRDADPLEFDFFLRDSASRVEEEKKWIDPDVGPPADLRSRIYRVEDIRRFMEELGAYYSNPDSPATGPLMEVYGGLYERKPKESGEETELRESSLVFYRDDDNVIVNAYALADAKHLEGVEVVKIRVMGNPMRTQARFLARTKRNYPGDQEILKRRKKTYEYEERAWLKYADQTASELDYVVDLSSEDSDFWHFRELTAKDGKSRTAWSEVYHDIKLNYLRSFVQSVSEPAMNGAFRAMIYGFFETVLSAFLAKVLFDFKRYLGGTAVAGLSIVSFFWMLNGFINFKNHRNYLSLIQRITDLLKGDSLRDTLASIDEIPVLVKNPEYRKFHFQLFQEIRESAIKFFMPGSKPQKRPIYLKIESEKKRDQVLGFLAQDYDRRRKKGGEKQSEHGVVLFTGVTATISTSIEQLYAEYLERQGKSVVVLRDEDFLQPFIFYNGKYDSNFIQNTLSSSMSSKLKTQLDELIDWNKVRRFQRDWQRGGVINLELQGRSRMIDRDTVVILAGSVAPTFLADYVAPTQDIHIYTSDNAAHKYAYDHFVSRGVDVEEAIRLANVFAHPDILNRNRTNIDSKHFVFELSHRKDYADEWEKHENRSESRSREETAFIKAVQAKPIHSLDALYKSFGPTSETGWPKKKVLALLRELNFLPIYDPQLGKDTEKVIAREAAHQENSEVPDTWHPVGQLALFLRKGSEIEVVLSYDPVRKIYDFTTSGHMAPGETEFQTIARESKEEVWLDQTSIRLSETNVQRLIHPMTGKVFFRKSSKASYRGKLGFDPNDDWTFHYQSPRYTRNLELNYILVHEIDESEFEELQTTVTRMSEQAQRAGKSVEVSRVKRFKLKSIPGLLKENRSLFSSAVAQHFEHLEMAEPMIRSFEAAAGLKREDISLGRSMSDEENSEWERVAEEVAEKLDQAFPDKPVLAFIDGLMGSGKSTLAKRLVAKMQELNRHVNDRPFELNVFLHNHQVRRQFERDALRHVEQDPGTLKSIRTRIYRMGSMTRFLARLSNYLNFVEEADEDSKLPPFRHVIENAYIREPYAGIVASARYDERFVHQANEDLFIVNSFAAEASKWLGDQLPIRIRVIADSEKAKKRVLSRLLRQYPNDEGIYQTRASYLDIEQNSWRYYAEETERLINITVDISSKDPKQWTVKVHNEEAIKDPYKWLEYRSLSDEIVSFQQKLESLSRLEKWTVPLLLGLIGTTVYFDFLYLLDVGKESLNILVTLVFASVSFTTLGFFLVGFRLKHHTKLIRWLKSGSVLQTLTAQADFKNMHKFLESFQARHVFEEGESVSNQIIQKLKREGMTRAGQKYFQIDTPGEYPEVLRVLEKDLQVIAESGELPILSISGLSASGKATFLELFESHLTNKGYEVRTVALKDYDISATLKGWKKLKIQFFKLAGLFLERILPVKMREKLTRSLVLSDFDLTGYRQQVIDQIESANAKTIILLTSRYGDEMPSIRGMRQLFFYRDLSLIREQLYRRERKRNQSKIKSFLVTRFLTRKKSVALHYGVAESADYVLNAPFRDEEADFYSSERRVRSEARSLGSAALLPSDQEIAIKRPGDFSAFPDFLLSTIVYPSTGNILDAASFLTNETKQVGVQVLSQRVRDEFERKVSDMVWDVSHKSRHEELFSVASNAQVESMHFENEAQEKAWENAESYFNESLESFRDAILEGRVKSVANAFYLDPQSEEEIEWLRDYVNVVQEAFGHDAKKFSLKLIMTSENKNQMNALLRQLKVRVGVESYVVDGMRTKWKDVAHAIQSDFMLSDRFSESFGLFFLPEELRTLLPSTRRNVTLEYGGLERVGSAFVPDLSKYFASTADHQMSAATLIAALPGGLSEAVSFDLSVGITILTKVLEIAARAAIQIARSA